MITSRGSHRALSSLLMVFGLGCAPEVELIRAPMRSAASVPRWTVVDSNTTRDLYAVWGTGSDDIWAVGDNGTAIRWNGSAWRVVPSATTASLRGVWAARGGDVWFVGTDAMGAVILRGDGSRWNTVRGPMTSRVAPRAVWGSAPDDVWIVGEASPPETPISRWNGTMLRPEFLPGGRPSSISAVGGTSRDDVWAAGEGPLLSHWRSGSWSLPPMPPRNVIFSGVMCVASDNVLWAATVNDMVLRFGGGGWTPTMLPTMSSISALWCGRGNDVWAVGNTDQAAHWDGTTWTPHTLPRANLEAVWGSPSGEVWAVGAGGAVLRFGL